MEHTYSKCNTIKDQLNKDICLFRFKQQSCKPVQCESNACQDISDPVLKYICNRMSFRPHMIWSLNIRLHKPILLEKHQAKQCSNIKEIFSNQMCNYTTTKANTASFNNNFIETCSTLSVPYLVSECLFVSIQRDS